MTNNYINTPNLFPTATYNVEDVLTLKIGEQEYNTTLTYDIFIKTEKKLLNDELKIFSHSHCIIISDDDPKCSVTKALENKLKSLEDIEIQFNGKSIIIDTTFVELGTEMMIPYKVKYQKKKKETLMKLTFENVLWTSAGGFHRYDIYLVAKNDQLTVSKIKAFYISKEFDSYGKEKTGVIYPTK